MKKLEIGKKYIVLNWKEIETVWVFGLEQSPGYYIENPISKKLMRLIGIMENDELEPK